MYKYQIVRLTSPLLPNTFHIHLSILYSTIYRSSCQENTSDFHQPISSINPARQSHHHFPTPIQHSSPASEHLLRNSYLCHFQTVLYHTHRFTRHCLSTVMLIPYDSTQLSHSRTNLPSLMTSLCIPLTRWHVMVTPIPFWLDLRRPHQSVP